MKDHAKDFESFLGKKRINEKIDNIHVHRTKVQKLSEIVLPDPEFGDMKLSVFPFEHTGKWITLPEGFKAWEKSLNDVMKHVPVQENATTHYVTIDTKFFTTPEYLRREGVHVDGNFCVDPKFVSLSESKETWGGIKPTWGGIRGQKKETWGGIKPTWGGVQPKAKASWGGASPKPTWGGASLEENVLVPRPDNSHVKMDWVLPYKLMIPVGDYISEKKGGILTVSTEVGCQAWNGVFEGEILGEGSFELMKDQLTDDKKVIFEKNALYFMSSNTPHETLLIDKGKRRTFLRVTLNHEYLNEQIS